MMNYAMWINSNIHWLIQRYRITIGINFDYIHIASHHTQKSMIQLQLEALNRFSAKINIIKNMKKPGRGLTYNDRVAKCEQFVTNFQDFDMMDTSEPYQKYGRRRYMIELQEVANCVRKTIEIKMEHLEAYFRKQDEKELLRGFMTNTHRYNVIFTTIMDKIMPPRNIEHSHEDEIKFKFENILREQRRDNLSTDGTKLSNEGIPNESQRELDVYIVYGSGSKMQIASISDLSSDNIGGMVVCKAIVVRATDVKPKLVVATYACDVCGCQMYNVIGNDKFSHMKQCKSKKCIENNINGNLTFLPGHSTFSSYQQLRIQETPDQLREGKIPKTFAVILKGSLVKQASPGDVVLVQGILGVHERNGNGKYHNDLAFDTHLIASKVTREKKKYVEMFVTEERLEEIQRVRSSLTEDEIYEKMARSIAPQIFGLEDVKKALLLLMIGGVTKQTQDHMKIRGEINVALFGDPGIAKSQLLKHISHLAPRGVYTTGKGSSGVGLTAAVVKDPSTQELALEAGALVLADKGVCCIDEFDKMDEYDRTAIHEVMEQQTISIAKAGITTTLNARSSILAAANPVMGRYDKRISPQKNINLPAALLSRFDLIFILLDSADETKDKELARHIGQVHKFSRPPQQEDHFTPEFIRSYIAQSKQFVPVLTEELHYEIIERYIKKRQEQVDMSKQGQSYTTMRSLLALIRLCQARARLRFSNEITKSDINDSLQLIEQSQRGISNTKFDRRKEAVDDMTATYSIIVDLCNYSTHKQIEYDTLLKRVLARGFSEQVLKVTIDHYDRLNILMKDGDNIRLVEPND